MKCTAADIQDLAAAFARHGGMTVPAKLALPFGRFQRAVKAEAEVINEAVQAATQQHLARDAAGKPVEIKLPDGRTDYRVTDPDAYQAAIREIRAGAVEIPGEPFPASELFRVEVPSDLVAALVWAVKD